MQCPGRYYHEALHHLMQLDTMQREETQRTVNIKQPAFMSRYSDPVKLSNKD